MVHFKYIFKDHRLHFPNKIDFLFLKIIFCLTYSVDPNEMPLYVAFNKVANDVVSMIGSQIS